MSRPDGGSVRKVRLLPTGWLESLRQAGLGAPLIVLLVPVLVTVWIYVGRDAGSLPLLTPLARHWSGDVLDAVYEYLTALLLLFAVPVLVGRILLERRPEELGLTPGDVGLGLRLVAILLPLALLTAYLGSLNPQMRSEYPLAKSVMFHPWFFLGIEVVYLVYYFAWEFCFRGFMLFGLEREWGVVAAVLVQTLTSTMAH
ncbi:MAG: hypothetical protein H5T69_12410, partial [Chloroflexi bacterium]|nr:hypothetical protein [Chloroflexota bacterium]